MKENSMPRADFITSIILIVFGIAVLILSVQMPKFEEHGVNPYSVPGIVPGFLGALIGFLGVVLFIRSILRKGYKLGITGQTVGTFFTSESTKRFALTILISVIYALVLLGRTLYSVATLLYVFTFIFVFEYEWKKPFIQQWQRVVIAALIAVLVAAGVTAVFQYLFLVNLPGPG
jgi:hypothetical protein